MATVNSSQQKSPEAQNPLILRAHRLMEAFAKSDDERDFYLDRVEGFIIYVDLDKSSDELALLKKEVESSPDRYCPIPKLTFFETKKIMEGFVNEKVYDIDTKEKLLDIIQSKEGRENFLEFIYDHHHEFEKWQQYYQERSRIRIIEWLRGFHFHFVFEEDLELPSQIIEKLKHSLFQKSVPKELETARKALTSKAKTYYSNEALNPRPKRGRPPKQQEKVEIEPQITADIYTNVPSVVRPFLFTPEISSVADITFSSRFETTKDLIEHKKHSSFSSDNMEDGIHSIGQKIAQLRQLSNRWMEQETKEFDSSARPKQHFSGLQEEDRTLFKKLDEEKNKIQQKTQKKEEKQKDQIQPKTIKKLSIPKEDKKTKPPLVKKTATKATKVAGKKEKLPTKKEAPSKKINKRIVSPVKSAPSSKNQKSKTKPIKSIKEAPKKIAKRPLARLTTKSTSSKPEKKMPKAKLKPLKKLTSKPAQRKR